MPYQHIQSLDDRSSEIFCHIVETYLDCGEPLGSYNLARQLSVTLSPASVRNVMANLENRGLIYAPHVSSGRLPTELGLRYFVDDFLEIGDLTKEERHSIESQVTAASMKKTIDAVLTEASQMLSGLTQGAGLVIAAKSNRLRLKHIEFIRLEATKALVIVVDENGSVENRILELPPDMETSTLIAASNYLNTHIVGLTIDEAKSSISTGLQSAKNEIDDLACTLVNQGLATWEGTGNDQMPQLIIRGRGNLLGDLEPSADLERLRHLFDEMESKQGLMELLNLVEEGEGVKIFIGSENKMFSLSGSSVVVAPYRGNKHRIIGAVGVIGPTRLNYARIVPMVDYIAKVVSRLLS